jgi:TDG/mug DNA glycosylase family protein
VSGAVRRGPSAAELLRARRRRLPDVIAPGLAVVFCGINPSLYSAAVGHHFARPGNRFWPVLHRAGFTERLYSPFEDRELLALGYGITNVVGAATARADELSPAQLVAGVAALSRKLARFRPRYLAVLGLGAYRMGFGHPHADCGPTQERIGETRLWVLPNPSGLNASFQLPELVRLYRELKRAATTSR